MSARMTMVKLISFIFSAYLILLGVSVGTFGYEKLSEIFNPYIRAFAISNKPRDQRISHIVLRNCKDLKLELDLDRIYREAAAITDLSFQSVNSLDLKFR